MKYVAEIPVRLGSKRVAKKNLRLINGKPMVAYSIEACKGSKRLNEIYINSEAEILNKIAKEYNVNYYRRKDELSKDEVVQDQFNYDFLCNIDTDALVMVNPVSPLVLSTDIDDSIDIFEKNNLDTLISIKEEKLQSFYQNEPINFSTNALLPMTQNLSPVQLCVWTICIWKKKTFIEYYEKNGYAVFIGKLGFFPINPTRAIKVSTEEDFRLAEMILKSRESIDSEINYYE